jgi:integrase
MGKYRNEKGIIQRQNADGTYSFQVRIRSDYGDFTKTFSEKHYSSAKVAFNSAVNYRNKVMYEIENGLMDKKDNSTVQDMFDKYMETTTDSYKTKDYHEKLFNKYINTKTIKIQELTKADILSDLNRMISIASDDTIGRVYAIYRDDIVGTALFEDIISRDITLGIRRPKSELICEKRGVTTDRSTVLEIEDRIQKSVSDKYNAKVIVCLIETLYYTGMRPAEVEVLTKDDIKDGYISITKELGSNSREKGVIRRPKTPTSRRMVPIHTNLVPVLKDLMKFAKTEFLFAKSDGSFMDSTWIGNIIRYVRGDLEFNLYRLRHNMATSLVTQQIDSKTTMEILGHAHYDMSLYYASSNKSLKEDAIDRFS